MIVKWSVATAVHAIVLFEVVIGEILVRDSAFLRLGKVQGAYRNTLVILHGYLAMIILCIAVILLAS